MKLTINKGEIWRLGNHILGCGSSLDKEFVDKVIKLGGVSEVRCILSDPPYGVAYVEGKKGFNNMPQTNKIIQGDQLQTDEEYKNFTAKYLELIKPYLSSYNAYYLFNADTMFSPLKDGIRQAGYYYSQMVIWVKNQVVIGRKDYLPMHELIAYGWMGRHKFERSKAKSVLFHPKPSRSTLHPTQKPIGLLRKIIPNSTRIGEWIYDPFLGSGSTLIASEHLGRRCVGTEIEESYCGTIIERWESLTQQKAERLC